MGPRDTVGTGRASRCQRVGQLDERSAQDRQTAAIVRHVHAAPAVGVGTGRQLLGCNRRTQHGTRGEAQHAGFAAEASLRHGARREHGTGGLRLLFTIKERLAGGVHADRAAHSLQGGVAGIEALVGQDTIGAQVSEQADVVGVGRALVSRSVVRSHVVATGRHGEQPVRLGADRSIGSVLVGDGGHSQGVRQIRSLRQRRHSRGAVGSRHGVRRGHVGQVVVRGRDLRQVARGGAGRVEHVRGTEQRISRVGVRRAVGVRVLREVHKVADSGRAVVVHGTDSSSATCERRRLCHVDDVPVTDQARGRRVETSCSHGGRRREVCQRAVQHGRRARRHAVHVLDSRVQGVGRRRAGGRCRNVSHVEDFNVAFTRLVGQVGSHEARVQAVGHETLGHVLRQSGQRAGAVSRLQLSHAIGTSRHGSRPHVARRHEDLEVQNVVGVQGATETDLHSLAAGGVGVHHVQNGHVAVLRVEVRHQQCMAHAAFGKRQRGSGRCRQRSGADDNISGCSASEAQATNHGSNAQGQNIFLHIENSS